MSIKDKIASILSGFGAKPETPEAEEPQAQPAQPAQGPPEVSVPEDPALLKLPGEHPLLQLYSIRRKEGGRLPPYRLCLDEDGSIPEEVVRREKNRLQAALKNTCSARLKQVKNMSKEKPAGKEKEDEKPKAEPQGLDALPWFFISTDKLYAWLLVFPPTEGGAELSREMLYRAMKSQNITYGVDTRLADRLSRDESRYFNLFLLAKGKPAFDGKNGNIVDCVPRVIERVLQVDEFDQVDYTALNLFYNVKEGQEICRLIRPTEGDPGRTVLGQEIPAKSGKPVPLPKGRNTEISEDGDVLVAAMDGHVEFTGRSFQVKPVLDVPGNVDFSTGNIKFLGDINIQGDVLSGFTVRAMGSIWVGGIVEAGSTVEAGGDLTVVKGILGDGTTAVRAQRCIFSKYIENSTIYARETLQTDAIINGRIYCDGEVLVRSGRGSIMGGRIWAAKKVNAASIGSRSECRTSIVLGGQPCANFEREQVQRELKALEMEMEKTECQLDSPAKTSILSKLRMKMSVAELKLKQLDDELADLDKEELKEKEEGRLECGVAHAGTEVSFGEETLRLRQESHQCVVKMVCGEIVMM